MINIKKGLSILFLAKRKPFAVEAAELVSSHVKKPVIIFGEISDAFPDEFLDKEFDYVISYISPWIVPERILQNAKKASINFHPGPPDYPGIGCTNFALYNSEKEFGITVHHMKAAVDSGPIIAVAHFPIFENDSVYSLTQRCYAYIYTTFINIFSFILYDNVLPTSNEEWKRKPFTRRELNELCIITNKMSEDEIRRRVRATSFPNMPGAYLELGGIRFLAEKNF